MIGRFGLRSLLNSGERSGAAEVARLHLYVYRQQRVGVSIHPPPLDLGQHPSTKKLTSLHSVPLPLQEMIEVSGYLHPVDRVRYSRMPEVVLQYLPTPTQNQ